jgi:tetratricopeptide (TPR) repeat protein
MTEPIKKPSETLLSHLVSEVELKKVFVDEDDPNSAIDRMTPFTAAGSLFLMDGRYREAAECFYRAYRTRKDDFWAKLYLGDIFSLGDHPDKANYFYTACLEQAPPTWTVRPMALTNLAGCQLKLGRFTEAEQTLEEAIATAPQLDRPYYMKAVHHAYQGNLWSALSDVRRGMQHAPDSFILRKMERDLLKQIDEKNT